MRNDPGGAQDSPDGPGITSSSNETQSHGDEIMPKRNRWIATMTRAARQHAETAPSPRALRRARRVAGFGHGDLLAAIG